MCKRAKAKGGEREGKAKRHSGKLRARERERERGRNVLTRRFLSELPKLIISSGLAKLGQKQESTAKPQSGQALPTHGVTTPPPRTPLPNRRRCLSWPGQAWHRAFACSVVLIKSFIVLHSRKELRRNTEQDGVEGRRESERGEKRGEKREGGKLDLYFLSCVPFFSQMKRYFI